MASTASTSTPDPEKADRTFGIKVEPGSELTIDLQWDEPWKGVATDLDSYLLNASGFLVQESAEANVETSQMPVEVLSWLNESSTSKTVQLVVNRALGEAAPRVKLALLENGGGVEATEYPRSSGEDAVGPTIFGHSGSASAISVAAVPFSYQLPAGVLLIAGARHPRFRPGRRDHAGGASRSAGGNHQQAGRDRDRLRQDDLLRHLRLALLALLRDLRRCSHAAAVAALMLDAEPAADPEAFGAPWKEAPRRLAASAPARWEPAWSKRWGRSKKCLPRRARAATACEPPGPEVEPDEAAAPGNWGSEVPPPPVPPSPPVVHAPSGRRRKEEAPAVPGPADLFLQRPSKVIRTRHHAGKGGLPLRLERERSLVRLPRRWQLLPALPGAAGAPLHAWLARDQGCGARLSGQGRQDTRQLQLQGQKSPLSRSSWVPK